MKFILAFGAAFQLPVALTLMAKAGLVGSQWLRENRKYTLVGMLVAAALVTPPDVFSMMLMFSVVYSLYELSILLAVMVERKREEKLRAEGYYDDEEDEDDPEDAEDAEDDPLLAESETWDDDSKDKGP
jgi:sec-independent protein translocase protein TatC